MSSFIEEFAAKRKEYKAWMLGPDKWDKRSVFHPMELVAGIHMRSNYYRNKELVSALKCRNFNTVFGSLGTDFKGLLQCSLKKS